MRHKIAKVSELEKDEMNCFEVEGERVILAFSKGELHALHGICTHQEFDLCDGFLTKVDDESLITCPLHMSAFKVSTGEPLNPPAEEPLKKYKVSIEGNDVYLEEE